MSTTMTALLWVLYIVGASLAFFVVMCAFEGVDPRVWRWHR